MVTAPKGISFFLALVLHHFGTRESLRLYKGREYTHIHTPLGKRNDKTVVVDYTNKFF